MRSSCLKLLSSVASVVLLAVGCVQPDEAWQTVTVVDNGGFEVSMPRPAGVQRSTIYLNADQVPTHINILADSGITYVASWFDLPEPLAKLPSGIIPDTVWSLMNQREDAEILSEEGPLASPQPDQRHAWLRVDGTRIGVVMVFRGHRVAILNSGTPDQFFGERERRNIQRFLRSYRPL